MTEQKKHKRVYCYGRRGVALTTHQQIHLRPGLDDSIDFIAVELGLEQLDDKPYVSITFIQRVIKHLIFDLRVPKEQAEQLAAMRMDHPTYKSLLKSLKDEDHFKKKVYEQKVHQKLMADQAWEKERKKNSPLNKTGVGNYGLMGAEFGMKYFFEDKTEYLHFLEGLLKDHRDQYLDITVDNYPRNPKMEWIQYHYSFEEFWSKVLKARTEREMDFSEPGLASIRRLATYLFTWNFRRYISGQIIYRHARFLPRLYRHLHVAAMLDTGTVQEVDLEYDEVPFEIVDEFEEPGDNIGNR